MSEIFPVDVDIREKQILLFKLIEQIKDGSLKYSYPLFEPDVRILENLWLFVPSYHIVLSESGDIDYGYFLYKGLGLIQVLKYYVIDDNIIEGLKYFTEYNGKKYSELPRMIQRRTEDKIVCANVIRIDGFSDEKSTFIINNYIQSLAKAEL